MSELVEKWKEFKETEEYTAAVLNSKAASMGMGFFGGSKSMFESFMEWLEVNL